MKKLLILLVAALAFQVCGFNVSAADQDGFVQLFNGKDLSGWKMGPAKSWVVQNGVITLKRAKYEAKEHNSDYLWAAEPYGNFIVELEFKVPEKANSGIYLRTSDPNNPVPTGIEVQVLNSYGQTQLHNRSTAGAIYDCVTPTANAIKAPGQWNQCRITCQDSRITVVLNGVKVSDMDLDRWTEPKKNPDGTSNKFATPLKNFARTGFFGFQDHGLPVWYRNIRIKKL